MSAASDLQTISRQFAIFGEFLGAEPYGSGHINDTYCARYDQGGTLVRYVHQRINDKIFKNPEALMDNIRRVTEHLRQRLGAAGAAEPTRRALTLIPARDGRPYYRDGDGHCWRTYVFIERARTYDTVQTPQQAFEAARAFGRFQQLLADLPAPRLHDTIPDFHSTPKRFAALEGAIAADAVDRARLARLEIEFAMRRQPLTRALIGAGLTERITHNDTKVNNVMLDDATGEGVCVIDLDTVMPGLALYDFGDMVRTATSPAAEDERDVSKVRMQIEMFEALVRGYLESAGAVLTPAEKSLLAVAGKVITFEIGIRFLADFLAGDVYFKTRCDDHNLIRCRTQFKLIESIEAQEDAMARCVARAG